MKFLVISFNTFKEGDPSLAFCSTEDSKNQEHPGKLFKI